jgi:hypothetical protein
MQTSSNKKISIVEKSFVQSGKIVAVRGWNSGTLKKRIAHFILTQAITDKEVFGLKIK